MDEGISNVFPRRFVLDSKVTSANKDAVVVRSAPGSRARRQHAGNA